MSQVADRYRTLSEAFEQRVRAVSPDQWAAPSPCEGWTARDVVRHVVDVHGMMLGFIGRTLSPAPGVDQDPAAALHAARADVQAVLDDPAIATTEYDGLLGRTTIEATIDTATPRMHSQCDTLRPSFGPYRPTTTEAKSGASAMTR